MSEFSTLHGQKIRFEWHRAQVQQIKFWNETQVSSSGGDGYMYDGYGYVAPLRIHSRNQQWQRVHVRWSDGKTGVVTVPGWVGISEGDDVSFLAAVNEKTKKWGWQGLSNHSEDQWYSYPSGAEVANFIPKGFFDHYSVVLAHGGFAGGTIGHLLCTGIIGYLAGYLMLLMFGKSMLGGAIGIALAATGFFFLYGIVKFFSVIARANKSLSAFNEAVNTALRASLDKAAQPLVADAMSAQ